MNSIILVVSSSMLIDFLTGGLTPNNGHYSYNNQNNRIHPNLLHN
jgi:hypothetical protein